MPNLTDLPDEIRLIIYEYVFCQLRIKPQDRPQQRRETRPTKVLDTTSTYPLAFAIFLTCKAIGQDPILHKALRSAAIICVSDIAEIEQVHSTLPAWQVPDLRHFSTIWKPRSVCSSGVMGFAIDEFVSTIKSHFPGMSSLLVGTNQFAVNLQHPTIQDMLVISEYAGLNGTSTRYMDDKGNQRAVDQMVYDQFHCCGGCIDHLVNAASIGVEVIFSFKIRPGHSFGRPGMSEMPHPVSMSTRDYILRVEDGKHQHKIPQRSFTDIQLNPPVKESSPDFIYSFETLNSKPTRTLRTADGAVLRSYEEDKVWRAG